MRSIHKLQVTAWVVLIGAILGGVLSQNSAQTHTDPLIAGPLPLPTTPAAAPEKVGLFFSTYSGYGPRKLGELQKVGGWVPWIAKHVEPAVIWALETQSDREHYIAVWNPFGVEIGEPMQPDQYLDAIEAGLNFAVDDFVIAWLEFREKYPEVQVLFYVGKPSADPTTRELIRSDQLEAAQARIAASFGVFLTVADYIGLDALSGSPAGGLDRIVVETLERIDGIEVVGELTPNVGTWQEKVPSVMLYDKIDEFYSPDRKPKAAVAKVPTWGEPGWPLYLEPGRSMIIKHPRVRWNDSAAMLEAVQSTRKRGLGVLMQPSPEIMAKPIDYYFDPPSLKLPDSADESPIDKAA